MPIVTVSLIGGRTQREKDRLAEAITESVCNILRVDKKEVVVVLSLSRLVKQGVKMVPNFQSLP